MTKVHFEGNRLYRNDSKITVWSSGREDEAHFYPIIKAALSPDERFILSMDQEGCLKLWDGNGHTWGCRSQKAFKTSDITAIAVPNFPKVILLATTNDVHCLQMLPGWPGDYGSIQPICSLAVGLPIAQLKWRQDVLTALDQHGNAEQLLVKF